MLRVQASRIRRATRSTLVVEEYVQQGHSWGTSSRITPMTTHRAPQKRRKMSRNNAAWLLASGTSQCHRGHRRPGRRPEPSEEACVPARIVLRKARTGKFTFTLEGPTGQILATSADHPNLRAAKAAIASVQKNLSGANVDDRSASTTAAKKTTARKTAAKKVTAARKTAAQKTTTRETAAKKTTARKTAAKKTTARKAAPRKTAAKKTTARKTAAKKTTARKTTAR